MTRELSVSLYTSEVVAFPVVVRGVLVYQIGIAGNGVVSKHVNGTFPSPRVYKYDGPKDYLTGFDFAAVDLGRSERC